MFKKIFNKFSLLAIIVSVFMIFGIANAVKLTNTISTGMSLEEVMENNNLEMVKDSGLTRVFKRSGETNAWYIFNTNTSELVYKTVIYPMESWDNMMKGFTENIGEPTEISSKNGAVTYFWELSGDGGIKMLNKAKSKKEFYFWYGSIPLWNELSNQSS